MMVTGEVQDQTPSHQSRRDEKTFQNVHLQVHEIRAGKQISNGINDLSIYKKVNKIAG